MSLTMEMLSIIYATKPPGPIPAGLKVTALADPNRLDPAKTCPALAIGSFSYWPLSYIDNRVSFGIVSYDGKGNIVEETEVKGARYVTKITMQGSDTSGSVTFWGQADQSVTMTLDQLYVLLLKP
jgi:hypothetical protein